MTTADIGVRFSAAAESRMMDRISKLLSLRIVSSDETLLLFVKVSSLGTSRGLQPLNEI